MNGISVIIPVYNGERTIETCIDSVHLAGNRVSEIIIVNDGSEDQTAAVIDKLADMESNIGRIKVIHTANHGSYMARVTGIKAATCPYIAFIDADDRFCEGALDLLAGLLEEHDADIAMGRIIKETSQIGGESCTEAESKKASEAVIRIQAPEEIWPRIMKWKTQEFLSYIWHKVYRSELLETLPEAEGLCQGDDVLITCHVFMKAKKTVETTAPVYRYHENPGSLTHSEFGSTDLDLIRVWNQIVEMVASATESNERKQTAKSDHPNLLTMAQYNRWRIDFTLICRLILADDPEADMRYAEDLNQWRNGLKKHWKALIRTHAMPASRELLIIALRFAFTPTKVAIRIIKRLQKSLNKDKDSNGEIMTR